MMTPTVPCALCCLLIASLGASELSPVPPAIAEHLGPIGPQHQAYPIPQQGAVFVAPHGLASSDGTSPDQPTTLGQAIAHARTGDVIILRGGLYRSGDHHFSKQITIQPYLDERPVLRGSKRAENWQRHGDHWITKWDHFFQRDPPKWHNNDRHGHFVRRNGDSVVIDGRILEPVEDIRKLNTDTFYPDYANHTITIAEDPTDKIIEITAIKHAFVRTHDDGADPIGPTIRGIDFIQFAGHCIDIAGHAPKEAIEPGAMPNAPIESRIEHCRFLDIPTTALHVVSPRSHIAHNHIDRIGNVGMMIRMSHHAVFAHNRVSRCNLRKLNAFPSGIKIFNQGYGYQVRNNVFSDMTCIAVWYDVGLREGAVINNYFKNCGRSVKIEISHRHYLINNIFDRSTVFLCNSANSVVSHNTFIDSRLDFMRNNRGRRGAWNKNFSFDHVSAGPGAEGYHGHMVSNNIFAGNPPEGTYIKMMDTNDFDRHFQAQSIANNLFLTEADAVANIAFKPDEHEATDYVTLADVTSRYASAFSSNSQIDNSNDELFVNPSHGDFRLHSIPNIPQPLPLSADTIQTLQPAPPLKHIGATITP